MGISTMITAYNTVVTGVASEILGIESRWKKPYVTRDLKKKRYETRSKRMQGSK